MRRSILSILLLAACANEPLAVFVSGALTEEQAEALDEAEALIGREIVMANRPYGAIEIEWHDPGRIPCAGGYVSAGCTKRSFGCRKKIKSIPFGGTVAHEIGHAFGLSHSDDIDDVMGQPSEVYTWEPIGFSEQEELDASIDAFALCWHH